MKHKTKKTTYR